MAQTAKIAPFTGDLAGAAALFEHARVRVTAEVTIGAAQLLGIWKSLIILHSDGTPRTKHVTTNPLIDLDEDADGPTIRARYIELVKRTHPDSNGGDRSAEHKLQRVIKAYQTLKKAKMA